MWFTDKKTSRLVLSQYERENSTRSNSVHRCLLITTTGETLVKLVGGGVGRRRSDGRPPAVRRFWVHLRDPCFPPTHLPHMHCRHPFQSTTDFVCRSKRHRSLGGLYGGWWRSADWHASVLGEDMATDDDDTELLLNSCAQWWVLQNRNAAAVFETLSPNDLGFGDE